jgi:hypothetical protein
MTKLTYADLVKQGVHLTKDEATALQSGVTHISKFGSDGLNDLFDYDKTGNQKASTAGGLGSIKQTPGFEPNGGNTNEKPPKAETAKEKAAREKQEKLDLEAKNKRAEELKTAGLEEREVTEQDLIDEPDLETQGVKVGDVHEFPIAEA